jgi:hypothetical protein
MTKAILYWMQLAGRYNLQEAARTTNKGSYHKPGKDQFSVGKWYREEI